MTTFDSVPSNAVQRLLALRAQITQRAIDCGRSPDAITLIAVSKTFSADEVWPTIEEGRQLVFGENRVQEAQAKFADLRARAAALGETLELHLIGPLQSNKAREAVETFDVIETVDREKIAVALAEAMAKTGRRPRLLVEINTGAEPQKAGVLPEDADRFLGLCRESLGLTIEGLMCIPPADELASPHFALLGEIARRNGISKLSMGMSADWPLAVQLGATPHPRRVGNLRFARAALTLFLHERFFDHVVAGFACIALFETSGLEDFRDVGEHRRAATQHEAVLLSVDGGQPEISRQLAVLEQQRNTALMAKRFARHGRVVDELFAHQFADQLVVRQLLRNVVAVGELVRPAHAMHDDDALEALVDLGILDQAEPGREAGAGAEQIEVAAFAQIVDQQRAGRLAADQIWRRLPADAAGSRSAGRWRP